MVFRFLRPLGLARLRPLRPWALAAALTVAANAAMPDAGISDFTDRHCTSCHNDVDKEASLDLTTLSIASADPANFSTWVKVHDRVQNGEMPPKEKKRPDPAATSAFIKTLGTTLSAAEGEIIAREGRALRRRLNGYEFENAIRDIFQAPWLEVRSHLPEDGVAHRYNKLGEALDISYVQVARFMEAADLSMRAVMSARLQRIEPKVVRYYAREEPAFQLKFQQTPGQTYPDRAVTTLLGTEAQPDVRARRKPPTVGAADPGTREREAVGWVLSYFGTGFNQAWSSFTAPATARYRVRFSGYTIWVGGGGSRITVEGIGSEKRTVIWPVQMNRPNWDLVSPGRRSEPITVYAKGATENRRVGGFDLHVEPGVSELEFWMQANESLVTDASRLFRMLFLDNPLGNTNPLATKDGIPGVAFRWIEVEGPLYDADSEAGYQLLFGDLPMERLAAGAPGVEVDVPPQAQGRGRGGQGLKKMTVDVGTTQPKVDAERLLRAFMQRVYRRPVVEREVQTYLGVIFKELDRGHTFAESMLSGYTGVLASPGFISVDEKPGRLDNPALATRLALFLWNSEPDEILRAAAARGELTRPDVLRQQAERMLADPKSRRFVNAFLDYWLDTRRMHDTSPSTSLYPDYVFDDSLTEAALDETQLFFGELLDRDLPVRNVVDSDFTYVNERLARHYDLPGISGALMRRITLPPDSPRGGLMTQASVLKVTANGTTTSPVIRGAWIAERILGMTIPPPPAAVPAIEPDIRGAATIRQQLEKHRADESCASCHRKIDPAGFALENFDVLGGWRERYRALADETHPAERGFGKSGGPFVFYHALPVESGGTLPDGRTFADIREFKRLVLANEPQLARNLAQQLVTYATGAPVRFSDRAQIEAILEQAKAGRYGVRSLVHAVVQSELFRVK